MRKPNEIMIGNKNLAEILENHKHWLKEDCLGWQEMRANLCCVDLNYIDFRYANLSYIDFKHANLSHANLCYADLGCTDLSGANLTGANLSYTNLGDAVLRGTNLRGVDFNYTNLLGASLSGAINIPYVPLACPETGAFIGYKKAGNYIVKLEILADAKRSSAASRKCRCDRAKVLEIQNYDGTNPNITTVYSNFDGTFVYKVGEIVTVKDFCENRWKECAPGIHFFINRQEAVNY